MTAHSKVLAESALKLSGTESPVSDYVPYSVHVTDTIVGTENTEYVTVWKIDGRSHLNASYEEARAWVEDLNNLLSGFASPHIGIWTHIVRRKISDFPGGVFENKFCHDLNEKYRRSFEGENMMLNEIYVSFVYRPVADKASSFFGKFAKESRDAKKQRQQDCIKQLEEINRIFGAGLGFRYGAENLSVYESGGFMYSQTAEFFYYLLNFKHSKVPVTRKRFSEVLPDSRPLFSPTSYMGEMVDKSTERRYFGMVDLFDYPFNTEPGHLNCLLEADYEFILTQSFTLHSKAASLGKLAKQQRDLEDAGDAAKGQIDEINYAMELVQSGEVFGGDHHATLNVIADSTVLVDRGLAEARAALADVAIIAKVVDSASEAAFWSQLPGNYSFRPRPAFITSKNFLSFNSLHNFLSGKATGNPWGDAVTILKTRSSSPLYFNFHYSADGIDATDKKLLGNTCMTGMSGTGKTVALNFFVAQAQKLGVTGVAFDKDRGLEVAIRLMGGRYLALKNGKRTGMNPYQLDDTPSNMAFLKRFTKQLIEEYGPVTHSDEVEIDKALAALMDCPRQDRRLSLMLQLLPNPMPTGHDQRPTVHARLLKWTGNNPLGWVFDNPDDVINLDTHKLYGFDVTEFLDNPETRAAVMMYLIYRTEAMIDGRRFMYLFDEFWKPLQDEYFQDLVKNKQKTIRKQNGLCFFATQEVDDLKGSAIASTLISQCATMIFLPNPTADFHTYTQTLKLTPTEFDLLKSLGESSRSFMIKQGGSVAVAKLDLYGFDDELLALSGTPELAELAEELAEQYGEAPELWHSEFLKQARSRKH